jgi:hypothetical protein
MAKATGVDKKLIRVTSTNVTNPTRAQSPLMHHLHRETRATSHGGLISRLTASNTAEHPGKAEHASFLAPEFLAYSRAERCARPIHGVANLRRRSTCGVSRGHDNRLAFLGVHETRCF